MKKLPTDLTAFTQLESFFGNKNKAPRTKDRRIRYIQTKLMVLQDYFIVAQLKCAKQHKPFNQQTPISKTFPCRLLCSPEHVCYPKNIGDVISEMHIAIAEYEGECGG